MTGREDKIFRSVRVNKGLAQWEVARALGVSRSTIYRIESGKLSPTVEMIAKMAEYTRTRGVVWFGYPDNVLGMLERAVTETMHSYERGYAEGKASNES